MTKDNSGQKDKDKAPIDFNDIYLSFSAAVGLNRISQRILNLAAHMTGAGSCSLMLLNGQGELYVLNAKGMDLNAARSFRARVGEGIAGQVAADGIPLIVRDIASDQRLSIVRRRRYRTGSFITCPISMWDKVIGVLNLNDKDSGIPFSYADLEQAEAIALIAAAALRNFLVNHQQSFTRTNNADPHCRLSDAERNNRKFIARLAHDIRTPLNNIKGAVYYLQCTSALGTDRDFFSIIEREVDYIISYFEEGMKKLEEECGPSISIL